MLPAVAAPGLPDQPAHYDDHVGVRDPEVDDLILPLGAPHQLLVGVVPRRVGSFHHPAQAGRERSRQALPGYHAHQAPLFQKPSDDLRVVGTVEVNAGVLGQPDYRLPSGVESGSQERRVVAVGPCRDHPERDTPRIHHRRAFDAPLAAVHRAPARLPAATRSFGDAPIDAHIGQFEADNPIVGGESDPFQSVHQTHLDPFVAPAPEGGWPNTPRRLSASRRSRRPGPEPALLEDHPIGYARTMAAEWVIRLVFGQQGLELLPDGLDDVWWHHGHGDTPSPREASATPQMIE